VVAILAPLTVTATCAAGSELPEAFAYSVQGGNTSQFPWRKTS
jgi:hypothetical protein